MTNTGARLADAVHEIFGIDPSLIFDAEIDPFEARIVRGVHDSEGHVCVTRDKYGEIQPVRVLEVFDMRRPVE